MARTSGARLEARESAATIVAPRAPASGVRRLPALPGDLALLRLLTARETAGLLGRLPLYVALAVALCGSSFLLQDQLDSLRTDGPQGLNTPLAGGLWVATLVVALFLGLSGALSLARERERGTLEVLFYAPLTATTVVLARFGALWLALLAAVAVTVPYFLAVAWLSGFAFSAAFVALLPLAVALGGPALALSVAVSCVARRVRGAALLFAAIAAVLLAIDLGDRVAGLATSAGAQGGLVGDGQFVLAVVAGALGWASPFAYLSRLADPLTASAVGPYLQAAGGAIVYTAVLLAVAVGALRWRGVRP
jgi:ABC-type transport system involved in multi-copper enzyme maturation permease subunit